MTLPAFLEQLAQLGIRLAGHGDRLRVEGPTALLTEELHATLACHKPEILRVLAGEWSLAASALLTRLVKTIPEDDWWELGDRFMNRVATGKREGNLPRSAAERIAYLELAAVADQQVHQHSAPGNESGQVIAGGSLPVVPFPGTQSDGAPWIWSGAAGDGTGSDGRSPKPLLIT